MALLLVAGLLLTEALLLLAGLLLTEALPLAAGLLLTEALATGGLRALTAAWQALLKFRQIAFEAVKRVLAAGRDARAVSDEIGPAGLPHGIALRLRRLLRLCGSYAQQKQHAMPAQTLEFAGRRSTTRSPTACFRQNAVANRSASTECLRRRAFPKQGDLISRFEAQQRMWNAPWLW